MGTVIADKHCHSSGCDDEISQPAEGIGNLPENEIAQDGGKDDLAVIVNGNFPCGGIGVCRSDGELPAGGCQTGQKQCAQLCHCHGVVAEEQVGQGHYAGKGGEKEHDKGPFYPAHPQCTNISVCHPGAKATQQTDQSGEARQIGRCGLDDEKSACESSYHAKPLEEIDLFLQNQDAEENGKKGGHFIQHGSVCQHQMVYGIEIAENTQRAADRAEHQEFFRVSVQFDLGTFFQQNHQGEKHCHKVAEEAFLNRGQVARQADEHIHECKGERGKQDAADPFIFL